VDLVQELLEYGLFGAERELVLRAPRRPAAEKEKDGGEGEGSVQQDAEDPGTLGAILDHGEVMKTGWIFSHTLNSTFPDGGSWSKEVIRGREAQRVLPYDKLKALSTGDSWLDHVYFNEQTLRTLSQTLAEQREAVVEMSGISLVGRRVRVYWQTEDEWFSGTVAEFRPDLSPQDGGEYRVEYDDGDEQYEIRESLVLMSDEDEEDIVGAQPQQVDPVDEADPVDAASGGRLKRRRQARVTYVNGQPVLKKNMYDLEGGEPSVFADGEELGAAIGDDTESSLRTRKKARVAAPASAKKPKKKGTQAGDGSIFGDLLSRNRKLLGEAKSGDSRRLAFLAQHLEVLRPFIAKKEETLLSKAANPALVIPMIELNMPREVTAVLQDHQVTGIQWLLQMYANNVNAILGDEMGLGKTLQTISLFAHLRYMQQVDGPFLVIAPLSVLMTWKMECAKWCPSLSVVRVHTSDSAEVQRLRTQVASGNFDVVVTTYEISKSASFRSLFGSKIRWRVAVFDEGHRAKNEESITSKALSLVTNNSQFTLILSGTPLQNNLHELWALLSLLHPDVFRDSDPFDEAFDLSGPQHHIDTKLLMLAHDLLKVFCLRRQKEDVAIALPPKVETTVMCPLSATQTMWYRRLLLNSGGAMERAKDAGTSGTKLSVEDWQRLRNLVMQLRICSNHPYLFPGAEPDDGGDDDLIEASGKLKVLDRLLTRLRAGGHRVVIFSQFTMMLDILEDYFALRKMNYARLDGSQNRVQRSVDMRRFNEPDSPLFCFLLSTRAGGLGVNLQSADTVILIDSDWNPQVDAQAVARVHRIGQTRPVAIFRLVTGGTVEERVVQRATKKLFLTAVVGSGAASQDDGEGKESLLLSTLTFGADAIFQQHAGEEPTDEQLDALCDRSEGGDARRAALAELNTHAKHSAASFDGEIAPPSTLDFMGTDYAAERRKSGQEKEAELAAETTDLKRSSRRRTKTTSTIDGYVVKNANRYSLNQGEPSVFDRESNASEREIAAAEIPRSELQRSGHHFESQSCCQACWDGGELILCDRCPAAYHSDCLTWAQRPHNSSAYQRWGCPLHECCVCGRGVAAVGGLLFTCDSCPHAYCEEDLPSDHSLVGLSRRFMDLGFRPVNQSYVIHCSPQCKDFAEKGYAGYHAPYTKNQGVLPKATAQEIVTAARARHDVPVVREAREAEAARQAKARAEELAAAKKAEARAKAQRRAERKAERKAEKRANIAPQSAANRVQQGALPNPPAFRVHARPGSWRAAIAPDTGRQYFYNTTTMMSAWRLPLGATLEHQVILDQPGEFLANARRAEPVVVAGQGPSAAATPQLAVQTGDGASQAVGFSMEAHDVGILRNWEPTAPRSRQSDANLPLASPAAQLFGFNRDVLGPDHHAAGVSGQTYAPTVAVRSGNGADIDPAFHVASGFDVLPDERATDGAMDDIRQPSMLQPRPENLTSGAPRDFTTFKTAEARGVEDVVSQQ
jgi:SWI/SNF-related matrix-associated actin-dependent regulator of chromatin subfamily A member 5